MIRCTTIFELGDIVHVPFPHIERAVYVRRPALIVAVVDTGRVGTVLWVLMITNAIRAGWIGDVAIPEAEARGLLIPSKIRTAKISTVDMKDAVMIGRLDDATWRTVRAALPVMVSTEKSLRSDQP